jgi:hypothetical protein
MANFYVSLIYPVCTDDTEAQIDRIHALGRPYGSAVWDSNKGTTSIELKVSAGNPVDAIAVALNQLREITVVIGVEPDSVESHSEREHLERLGGPQELEKMKRWLEEGIRGSEVVEQ